MDDVLSAALFYKLAKQSKLAIAGGRVHKPAPDLIVIPPAAVFIASKSLHMLKGLHKAGSPFAAATS
jgi:hypothetical protein